MKEIENIVGFAVVYGESFLFYSKAILLQTYKARYVQKKELEKGVVQCRGDSPHVHVICRVEYTDRHRKVVLSFWPSSL